MNSGVLNIAIMVLVVMTAVGLIFGLILAYANKKFAVEVNPLIHMVEDVLPKGQCGACGYAGCQAYAEAVVMNADVPPNLCIPGKKPVANTVAELTGKIAPEIETRFAYIACKGTVANASKDYNYVGVQDCVAANLLQSGPKSCKYGCLGLGTCVNNCPFEAMSIGKDGIPIVDKEKCTGCGKCETVCPKKVIKIIPVNTMVEVNCNSKDKGAIARKLCKAACIGCGICSKNCSFEAIKVENNLAIVDTHICSEKCSDPTCIAKCPTGAIVSTGIPVSAKAQEESTDNITSV
ncbi:RnfABCDGE type electron transport complex subunit B [Clostridium sp. DJ247]|uniref:RnfABCDGE type electron transport complex subunit B n=1 Tax=Clostridium sp. DJ247 TaxID=2726188 RepID=UPI0016279A84|nr:Fe-S cluster domain-containing protein [Clostridium sp. DJ247]MBC2580358.1 Fe-S cluster domain-containing protein [Clostridium sp. DJ247]